MSASTNLTPEVEAYICKLLEALIAADRKTYAQLGIKHAKDVDTLNRSHRAKSAWSRKKAKAACA